MKENKQNLNENASAGATSAGSVATVVKPLNNLMQRRLPSVSNLISNIYKKKKDE